MVDGRGQVGIIALGRLPCAHWRTTKHGLSTLLATAATALGVSPVAREGSPQLLCRKTAVYGSVVNHNSVYLLSRGYRGLEVLEQSNLPCSWHVRTANRHLRGLAASAQYADASRHAAFF